MNKETIGIDDVQAAARRLHGLVRRTPMLESEALNDRLGFRLLVKAEVLQRTGSFKLRGAFNNILQLTDEEKRRGVCAGSAGNFAMGLACAARSAGVAATIVMPHDAPRAKIDGTRFYGANIVFYNRVTESRDATLNQLQKECGLTLVQSYNSFRSIAGQGALGLEIFQQCRGELGVEPNSILAPCSGGSLTSGISLTRELYQSPPHIYACEPEKFDDAKRSLESGAWQGNNQGTGSICDALLMTLGDQTFPILQQHGVQGLAVSDADVQAAMALAAQEFKLTVEPGGAAALAAACLNRAQFKGQTVVAVLSGGNVDGEDYARHIQAGIGLQNKLLGAAL